MEPPDETLLAALARAHEGDPDAAEAAFHDEVVYVDETDGAEVDGLDGLLEHLSALGGRRERFLVTAVEQRPGGATLAYDLCFQADAGAFAQRGTADLRLVDGRVISWRARWWEVEIDRSPWEGA